MSQYIEKILQQQDQKKTTLVDMEISGNPRSLSLIRRILCSCAASVPLPAAFLNDIKLAVTEACTNIIKHAFKYDQNRKFSLAIQVCDDFFLIHVTYTDTDFNPDAIPLPDLSNIKEGGLGVFIIRNIMDNIHYATDPATGTVLLRMIKFIRRTPPPGDTHED